MAVMVPEVVEKEFIPSIHFNANKSNADLERRTELERQIFKAMVMGNTYRKKSVITFRSEEGLKQVHTTVWAYTQRNLVLKSGIMVPLDSIEQIAVDS
jgi:hypothetical protein